MNFIYPLTTFLQKNAVRLFADYKVNGTENVPPIGPLIVICNHQSNLDPYLLRTFISRRTWFLAKDELFNHSRIASRFLHSWGAFPLNRTGVDTRAYKWLINLLDHDQVVVVFPEGTRSPGAMKKALSGVVRLAMRSQSPILPVGIVGTEKLQAWYHVGYPKGHIRINIGEAFSLPQIDGRLSKDVLESLNDMMMSRVAELLPEGYRGVYQKI